MKGTKLFITLMVVGCICLFTAAAIYAGTKAADVIQLQSPNEPTKGPVEFHHKKHSTDYKGACGDCHHDDKGKPLTALKEGDDVKKCFDCHSKPGLVPKEEKKAMKAMKADEKQKAELAYLGEAFHLNCVECHKQYNKDNKTKAAPTTCTKCHPKTK